MGVIMPRCHASKWFVSYFNMWRALNREAESYVYITRQVSINARASVQNPIWAVNQAALLTRDESPHIIFEKRRRNALSLNQPRVMSVIESSCWKHAKMSVKMTRVAVSNRLTFLYVNVPELTQNCGGWVFKLKPYYV